MKSNITQIQQDLLKKYADEKCMFLYQERKYTFTDYALHENDIDIYILDENGSKDTLGIEAWQMEEFFGWFDAYQHSIEEEHEPVKSSIKYDKFSAEDFEKKVIESKAKKVKVAKPKKEKAMRNSKVSPLLEPIYEYIKKQNGQARGKDVAEHAGLKQNAIDYYLKKLINAGRIYKTADKHYTTDKKQANKLPKPKAKPEKKKIAPTNGHAKPAELKIVDTVYRIDPLLECLKESKRFHQLQAEKLDKMIEIWGTNI